MRRLAAAVLLSLSAITPAVVVAPEATAAVACQRTLASYPVLHPGARGPAVRALQCLLNDNHLGPVAVDGWYGPQTRAAVTRLESGFEGPAPHPGRIDAGYWVLLFGRLLPDRNLSQGAHGSSVVTLQRALRAAGATIVVDGDFGPQTKAVVKRYQRHVHTRQTGVLNANTRFFLAMGAGF